MSRFLARALADRSAEQCAAESARRTPPDGFGDSGGSGDAVNEASEGGPPLAPLAAVNRLAAACRVHGAESPEALAAARALLSACRGIADDPEERRCEPSWTAVDAEPPPGAWCGACGLVRRQGGRWWRERDAPKGWRCLACHPPPPGLAVHDVAT